MSSVKLSSNPNGTGVFTIAGPNSSTNRTQTLLDATGVVVLDSAAQTLTNKTLSGAVFTSPASSVLSLGVPKAASGTEVDFTSIPSWVRRITVMFNGVASDGTTNYIVQLGDSGGIEDTGYISYSCSMGSSSISSGGNQTTGFVVNDANSPGVGLSGQMIISYFGNNTWAESAFFSTNSGGDGRPSGGIKTLTGTLDRIRITIVAGSGETFTAGTINILYE